MIHESSLIVWGQWLSDHSTVMTLLLALLAFSAEALRRIGVHAAQNATPALTKLWASTWLTNASLLACAMAMTWLSDPWLSPWFSEALSGKSGLLPWLGFDHNPSIARIIIAIFLLDFITYVLHRVMHFVPIFWQVHQVHHSVTEMNASTQFRQHPLALITTVAMQLPLLWILGIPGISWVIYAFFSLAVELWHHSTLRLPVRADRWLGFILVTPRFHRTHHHFERRFHDSNYGSVFPIWDRLLGTVATAPVDATTGLISSKPDKTGRTVSLARCLLMPFQRARAAPADGDMLALKAKRRSARQKFQTVDGGK